MIDEVYIKLLYDMIMQCDNVAKVKRPDILVLNKTNECIIVDIAILGQSKIQEFEKN